MTKSKIREISILGEKGTFSIFRKGDEKFDFKDIASLRHVLSNEKVKLLHIIKTQKPQSIYDLAKKSKKNFKTVFQDAKLLERFGFIELIPQKNNNRKILKPIISGESITVHIKIWY